MCAGGSMRSQGHTAPQLSPSSGIGMSYCELHPYVGHILHIVLLHGTLQEAMNDMRNG